MGGKKGRDWREGRESGRLGGEKVKFRRREGRGKDWGEGKARERIGGREAREKVRREGRGRDWGEGEGKTGEGKGEKSVCLK